MRWRKHIRQIHHHWYIFSSSIHHVNLPFHKAYLKAIEVIIALFQNLPLIIYQKRLRNLGNDYFAYSRFENSKHSNFHKQSVELFDFAEFIIIMLDFSCGLSREAQNFLNDEVLCSLTIFHRITEVKNCLKFTLKLEVKMMFDQLN